MEQDKQLIDKVKRYKPSQAKLDAVRHVPLLLVAGISGAGKDTVLKKLVAEQAADYYPLVSHTTRKLRTNSGIPEQNGVEYFFIDKSTAEQMLDEGEYLEANYYSGNVYGASLAEIAKAGQQNKILVSDIDVNGVNNFVLQGMNVKAVFLLPPNYEVWQERFLNRYGQAVDAADLKRRLQTALDELAFAMEHDYFHFVINDKLDDTVRTVGSIAHDQLATTRSPEATAIAKNISEGIRTQLSALV